MQRRMHTGAREDGRRDPPSLSRTPNRYRGSCANRLAPDGFARRSSPRPSPVFDTYWRFADERQQVFLRRAARMPEPWTDDPILREYKFTNAYRASDRVSQYLIRRVIYDADRDFADTFVRVLLFKIFNRIETWELLESRVGEINLSTFDPASFTAILEHELLRGRPIYSAAYIMPTGGRRERKHRVHLDLLESMVRNRLSDAISAARSMSEAYELLLRYPMVGPFLAYQWLIDLNYSPQLLFDEMEFVMPGPGARDGLAKCFVDLAGWSEADVVRWVAAEQESQFERLGIRFPSLWGRSLKLIDCQNLFCEVDKYARVRHPEVLGRSGRQRIKQKFRSDPRPIEYFYPPKWHLQPSAFA